MRSLRPISLVLAILGGVMLVAMLAYPFGYDQAVYAVGGELVRAGKIPYRDFLDTKQPLIFYIYAAAAFLFGHHEWSVRLFDVLYQFGTLFYLYRILRRELSVELSLLSIALTAMLYAGSGFWMTSEAESFAVLPSLWLIDLTFRAANAGPLTSSRTVFRLGILAGLASGALLLLKFTLVIGAVPALIFIYLRRLAKRIKRSYAAGLVLSSAAFVGINLLYQWWVCGLHTFWQSLGWLWHYGSVGNDQHSLLAQIFLMYPERIVYSASVALVILAIAGLISARKRKVLAFRKSLLSVLLFTGLFQLFGVLLERKIEFPYQYTRALWAFTPFMALGLERLHYFLIHSKASSAVKGVLTLVAILGFLFLSPLPRIATQTVPWARIALMGEDAGLEVQARIPDYFAEDQEKVAASMHSKLTPNDRIFVWGNDVGIYFQTSTIPTTLCLTATPFRTSFTPNEWKTKLLAGLFAQPPHYFIAEFGDAKPYITGSTLDSYGSLLQWNEMSSFLSSHYAADTTIGHFRIFRSNN